MDILKEANDKSSSSISAQLAELRKELDGERDNRKRHQQEAERKARYDYYNRQTSEATKEKILGGFIKEDADHIREDAEEMVLAMAGAF